MSTAAGYHRWEDLKFDENTFFGGAHRPRPRLAPQPQHLGIVEPKIVVRFWIISAIFTLIALISIKLR